MPHLQVKQILFLLPCITLSLAFADPEVTEKAVIQAIKNGDASALIKLCNTIIDLRLPSIDGTYSKAQAGQILKDFLSRNPVKNFILQRQDKSEDGSPYTIAEMVAGSKKYRLFFLLMESKGIFLVQRLEIVEILRE
jgi:hypothetical protein